MLNNIGLHCTQLRSPIKNNDLGFGCKNCKNENIKIRISPENSAHADPERKFSMKRAARKFVQGVISPVTQIFKSVENFALSVAMLAGVGALTKVNKKVAPVLVAASAGFGGLNIIKGLNKIIHSKGNPEKRENSFYDLGKGSSIVALSTLPAKNALKTTAETPEELAAIDKMPPLKALGECIAKSPKLAVQTLNKIINSEKAASTVLAGVTGADALRPDFPVSTPDNLQPQQLVAVLQPDENQPKDEEEN